MNIAEKLNETSDKETNMLNSAKEAGKLKVTFLEEEVRDEMNKPEHVVDEVYLGGAKALSYAQGFLGEIGQRANRYFTKVFADAAMGYYERDEARKKERPYLNNFMNLFK
jgi:hypothetical protein